MRVIGDSGGVGDVAYIVIVVSVIVAITFAFRWRERRNARRSGPRSTSDATALFHERHRLANPAGGAGAGHDATEPDEG